MATWHQEQAARRAYNNGTPLRYDHPTEWTVYTSPPNRMASCIRWRTKEEAERYLANLKKLAKDNPNDVERQLHAQHSYILPPSTKETDRGN